MSRGHDMDVVDDAIHGSDDYGTNSEFHFEQENNSTPDAINNASNDRYEFRSNLNPPPGVKFGVHLLHVISSHRGVDLKLYDEIIDLIKNHATTQDTDFATHKLYHRKELTILVICNQYCTMSPCQIHRLYLSLCLMLKQSY
jgi:hypothetical protein